MNNITWGARALTMAITCIVALWGTTTMALGAPTATNNLYEVAPVSELLPGPTDGITRAGATFSYSRDGEGFIFPVATADDDIAGLMGNDLLKSVQLEAYSDKDIQTDAALSDFTESTDGTAYSLVTPISQSGNVNHKWLRNKDASFGYGDKTLTGDATHRTYGVAGAGNTFQSNSCLRIGLQFATPPLGTVDAGPPVITGMQAPTVSFTMAAIPADGFDIYPSPQVNVSWNSDGLTLSYSKFTFEGFETLYTKHNKWEADDWSKTVGPATYYCDWRITDRVIYFYHGATGKVYTLSVYDKTNAGASPADRFQVKTYTVNASFTNAGAFAFNVSQQLFHTEGTFKTDWMTLSRETTTAETPVLTAWPTGSTDYLNLQIEGDQPFVRDGNRERYNIRMTATYPDSGHLPDGTTQAAWNPCPLEVFHVDYPSDWPALEGYDGTSFGTAIAKCEETGNEDPLSRSMSFDLQLSDPTIEAAQPAYDGLPWYRQVVAINFMQVGTPSVLRLTAFTNSIDEPVFTANGNEHTVRINAVSQAMLWSKQSMMGCKPLWGMTIQTAVETILDYLGIHPDRVDTSGVTASITIEDPLFSYDESKYGTQMGNMDGLRLIKDLVYDYGCVLQDRGNPTVNMSGFYLVPKPVAKTGGAILALPLITDDTPATGDETFSTLSFRRNCTEAYTGIIVSATDSAGKTITASANVTSPQLPFPQVLHIDLSQATSEQQKALGLWNRGRVVTQVQLNEIAKHELRWVSQGRNELIVKNTAYGLNTLYSGDLVRVTSAKLGYTNEQFQVVNINITHDSKELGFKYPETTLTLRAPDPTVE